jgi:hypothetical protein
MLTTETRKAEGFSLSIVRELFLKEIESGLLFEKLTDTLLSYFVGLDERSILQISFVYSLDRAEFLFLSKEKLTERLSSGNENSVHFYDDYLLLIDEIRSLNNDDATVLSSAFTEYFNSNDKALLTSKVQEAYAKLLTEDFFESILKLQVKLDDFVAAKEVIDGKVPFRILNEESAGLFVEYLFHDRTKESFGLEKNFYSEEGIQKFNFFKEKLLTKIIKEKTEDLSSIFKPEYFLMFYQKDGISFSRFFELFNDLIEEDINSFHYLFNKDSDWFANSLSKVVTAHPHNNILKELQDDELVRSFKNLERINSLKKTNLEFIGISTQFYYEIIERGIKLEDYSDVKVSFWFLILKLLFPSQGINSLKKVPILLYKTDVLSVLERLSTGKEKQRLDDYSPDELSEGGIETLSYLKDEGFEFKVPMEFYNNLKMFSELVDNGFSATETGSYEFVAKRLLELFQVE